jgi:hypothetical protein
MQIYQSLAGSSTQEWQATISYSVSFSMFSLVHGNPTVGHVAAQLVDDALLDGGHAQVRWRRVGADPV